MTWQTLTGHPQFPTSSPAEGLIPRYDTRWHPCRAGSGCKWHTPICWCSGVCSAGSGCDGYRCGMGAGSIAILKLFKRRFGCFLWFMLACQVVFFLFSVSWYVWAEDVPYLAYLLWDAPSILSSSYTAYTCLPVTTSLKSGCTYCKYSIHNVCHMHMRSYACVCAWGATGIGGASSKRLDPSMLIFFPSAVVKTEVMSPIYINLV